MASTGGLPLGNDMNNHGPYYVYYHLRKTDGSVFYVGVGSRGRAWNTNKRNKYWHRTVNKHGLVVEIVRRFQTREMAVLWERLLIAIHGRVEEGGQLLNFTNGGDGSEGYNHKHEDKLKMRLMKTEAYGIKCDCYDFKSRQFISSYGSLCEAARDLNINSSGISACVLGRIFTYKGYVFTKKGCTPDWACILENAGKLTASKRTSKPVTQYSLNGDLIKRYSSASEASRVIGKDQSGISSAARGEVSKAYGFIWKYD